MNTMMPSAAIPCIWVADGCESSSGLQLSHRPASAGTPSRPQRMHAWVGSSWRRTAPVVIGTAILPLPPLDRRHHGIDVARPAGGYDRLVDPERRPTRPGLAQR